MKGVLQHGKNWSQVISLAHNQHRLTMLNETKDQQKVETISIPYKKKLTKFGTKRTLLSSHTTTTACKEHDKGATTTWTFLELTQPSNSGQLR